MSLEDEYVKNYLNQHPDIENFWLEVPYNKYGERGYVDLVVEFPNSSGDNVFHVIEVKSESAIREATGSNEIIRQFNKMVEYFIEGQQDNIVNTDNYGFTLDIIKTEYTLEHLRDNKQLYESIHTESGGKGGKVRLVDQNGTVATPLHNLNEWMNDDMPNLDISNPRNFSPISILEKENEPDSQYYCHRHGLEKENIKPVIKSNNNLYTLKDALELFYCQKCLAELAIIQFDEPKSAVNNMGGFAKMAVWSIQNGDVEDGGIENVFGWDDDWWETIDATLEKDKNGNQFIAFSNDQSESKD